MNGRMASLSAAIGAALLAVMYLVNNVIPLVRFWSDVATGDALRVLITTLIPALVWSGFFFTLFGAKRKPTIRSAAIFTIAIAILPTTLLQAWRELPTLSLLSLDSVSYLATGFGYAAGWTALLIAACRERSVPRVALFLLLVAGFETAWNVYGFAGATFSVFNGAYSDFFATDAMQASWRLLLVPAIQSAYWASQALFLHAARKNLTPLSTRAITA